MVHGPARGLSAVPPTNAGVRQALPGLRWTDLQAPRSGGAEPRFAVLLVLAVVAALLPLAIHAAPPILDYPNHLARGVILAGGMAPEVARHYAVSWSNVPNLAVDAILVGLLRLFAPQTAGRVLLALVVLVQFAGLVVYARVVFGRWTLWSVAGIAAILGGSFFFGFLNYGLAVGLALLVVAGWRAVGRRHPTSGSVLLAVALVALWFTHLAGVLFAVILLFADELVRLFDPPRTPRDLVRRAVTACVPYVLPFAILAALYATSPIADASSPTVWAWNAKLRILAFVTGGPDLRVDMAVVVVLVGVLAVAFWKGTLVVDRASLVAAVLCTMIFLVAPIGAKSVWYVDSRFASMAWMLLFAGFAPALAGALAVTATLVTAGAVAVRLAVISSAWTASGVDIADVRGLSVCLPPGSRLVVADTDDERDLPRHRRMAFARRSAYNHLGAWAVIDRDVFWPFLFAYPGQQPIAVDPAYRHLLKQVETAKVAQYILPRADGGTDLSATAADFDFLIAMGTGKNAVSLPVGATEVASSGYARLIKLRPGPPEALCP